MGCQQTLESYAHATHVDAATLWLGGKPAFASSTLSSDVEAWQFVCGQGPTPEAYERNTWIEVPDTASTHRRWTWLADALGCWPFGAAFALPVTIGRTPLAVVTLYRLQPGPLSARDRGAARSCVDHALRRMIAELRDTDQLDLGQSDLINQAIGVVRAQTHLAAADAMATIRAHAYSSQRGLQATVVDIIQLRLTLPTPASP